MKTSHDDYACEAIGKMDSELLPLSTLTPIPEKFKVLAETAYRRGYVQGANACLEYVGDAELWIERLMEWRLKRHNGKIEHPPPCHAPRAVIDPGSRASAMAPTAFTPVQLSLFGGEG